jgi:hypothetical protein
MEIGPFDVLSFHPHAGERIEVASIEQGFHPLSLVLPGFLAAARPGPTEARFGGVADRINGQRAFTSSSVPATATASLAHRCARPAEFRQAAEVDLVSALK